MNYVKRNLIAVATCLLAIGAVAEEPVVEKSAEVKPAVEKALGVGAGLAIFEGDLGLQIRKDFNLGKTKRSEISLQGSFYNHDKFTVRLDADYHFVLTPNWPFRFYPLAGIDFSIRSKENRVGANVGFGVNIALRETVSAFVEAKYLAGDWDGYGFVIGINF
jgi:hypothetical protein